MTTISNEITDKERLDWIESKSGFNYLITGTAALKSGFKIGIESSDTYFFSESLRESIDFAIREEKINSVN